MKDPNLPKNYKNYKHKNIALVGHMGSGKSILGRLLAKKLKLKHLDSDQVIEQNTKQKIKEIFNIEGESAFRIIEEKTILDFKDKKNIVLSLGGGAILSEKIRNYLENDFITLFLDVNIYTLIERLKKSYKRPLILDTNIEKKIKELDKVRRKYYLLADITLENCENPINTINEFLKKYNQLDEKNN